MLPRLLPPQWTTVSIFQPATAAGFPNASAQGHLLAHFAPSIRPAAGCFGPERSQQAVDLTGTDGEQALAAGLFVLQPHGLEQANDFRSVFHGPAAPFGFRRRGGRTGYHRATLLLQFLDGVWSFVAAGPAPVVDGPPFGSLAGSLTVIVSQALQEFVKMALAHGG